MSSTTTKKAGGLEGASSELHKNAAAHIQQQLDEKRMKETSGAKLWEFETGGDVAPPPSALMARFTSGQMTNSSMPSRPTPKA
ncbi:MAG: hypothetical protein VYD34_01975 [Verrucomicrobiota bacterium]|nr:hypothetical protein [Verrucomicrobiota bacterium]